MTAQGGGGRVLLLGPTGAGADWLGSTATRFHELASRGLVRAGHSAVRACWPHAALSPPRWPGGFPLFPPSSPSAACSADPRRIEWNAAAWEANPPAGHAARDGPLSARHGARPGGPQQQRGVWAETQRRMRTRSRKGRRGRSARTGPNWRCDGACWLVPTDWLWTGYGLATD